MDVNGQVIPGLYCAGESQGGFAQHGLGRATVFGRIAGREAALAGDRT
jgi:succinate dehydrogenase/fumarate reductase flavoprotein subunit